MSSKRALSELDKEEFITLLKIRFEKNMTRHNDIAWQDVASKLETQPHKIISLHEMEETGGEPDVTGYDSTTGEYIFIDCSPESPKGRRSICFDRVALDKRKENKPHNTAKDMAEVIGIEILTEEQYRKLQTLGNFDLKTSSWIQTPEKIRKLGGALFADRRYDTVFVYHNGADSYYAARAFRGMLKV
ncbi:DUF4256 domain-containing protein [Flavobacterium psychrotrophum]|uniref:DUF4256 domain-containing protein n=1 Tax=Flavobacterium psychrotrophum TaxID=2294119 RepID=UPI000E324380|nr:DUF4256 domain-containing protein [Flavobacterium psychrotrophum]